MVELGFLCTWSTVLTFLQEGLRTAGVIVREGVGGGTTPTVQVLEIGTLSSKRHPSDILPFLAGFRHLMRQLPTKAADMTLKVCKIPLTDVECLTNTIVRLGGPIWYLNIKKGKVTQYLHISTLDSHLRYRGRKIRRQRAV